ncbi:hypothetical protein RhiirA5_506964 [Rhizophagus irregularis]|uniref:Uncharacterized protein n=1 Tax=Rhizophagus irregularis TaxID=588596 RepID=A0A2N0NPD2_9GLOM|nr:hypothetical protein RhiirA5_506964 [Rhizophagus irregularis]
MQEQPISWALDQFSSRKCWNSPVLSLFFVSVSMVLFGNEDGLFLRCEKLTSGRVIKWPLLNSIKLLILTK